MYQHPMDLILSLILIMISIVALIFAFLDQSTDMDEVKTCFALAILTGAAGARLLSIWSDAMPA